MIPASTEIQEESHSSLVSIDVDDIILAGTSQKRMKEVNEALARKFDIKDMPVGQTRLFRWYQSRTR